LSLGRACLALLGVFHEHSHRHRQGQRSLGAVYVVTWRRVAGEVKGGAGGLERVRKGKRREERERERRQTVVVVVVGEL